MLEKEAPENLSMLTYRERLGPAGAMFTLNTKPGTRSERPRSHEMHTESISVRFIFELMFGGTVGRGRCIDAIYERINLKM